MLVLEQEIYSSLTCFQMFNDRLFQARVVPLVALLLLSMCMKKVPAGWDVGPFRCFVEEPLGV